MDFYAHIGWYQSERLCKSRVSVSVEMRYTLDQSKPISDLSGVLDYEKVHLIVKNILGDPIALIEEATRRIFVGIDNEFKNQCEGLEVTVTKWHPPMGQTLRTSFTLTKP